MGIQGGVCGCSSRRGKAPTGVSKRAWLKRGRHRTVVVWSTVPIIMGGTVTLRIPSISPDWRKKRAYKRFVIEKGVHHIKRGGGEKTIKTGKKQHLRRPVRLGTQVGLWEEKKRYLSSWPLQDQCVREKNSRRGRVIIASARLRISGGGKETRNLRGGKGTTWYGRGTPFDSVVMTGENVPLGLGEDIQGFR